MAGMASAVKSSVAQAFGDRTSIFNPQQDGTIVAGGGGGYLYALASDGRVLVLDGPARKGQTFPADSPIAAAIWNEAAQLHKVKPPAPVQVTIDTLSGAPTGQSVGATDKLPDNAALGAGPKAEALSMPDDMGAASRVVLGGAMGASGAASAIDAWEASRGKTAAPQAGKPPLPAAKVAMGEPEFESARKFQSPGTMPDAETAGPDMVFARSATEGGTSEQDMMHARRLQIIMQQNPELRPILEPEYRKLAASAALGDAVHSRGTGGR